MHVQTCCFAHLTYCFFDVSKGVLDQSERALNFCYVIKCLTKYAKTVALP